MKNQSKRQLQKSITDHARQFLKVYHSSIRNALKREIYAFLQNKKQENIINQLKKLKLSKLAKNNIPERDLVNITELNAYPLKTLRQIAKLRNIDSNMSKDDTIYALIRSEPVINEQKRIINYVNEIPSKINDIRLQLFTVSPYMNKKAYDNIRKRLYDIRKMTKIDRSLKNKLLKELNSISGSLQFVEKNMKNDYRDENYANIDDIEYMFGDIDDYYEPILASSLFNNGYQRYHISGDKSRDMSVKSYFDKIIPYLKMRKKFRWI